MTRSLLGVTVFELARIMGTSVAMTERHYGTLLDGATDASPDASTHSNAERDEATGKGSDCGR